MRLWKVRVATHFLLTVWDFAGAVADLLDDAAVNRIPVPGARSGVRQNVLLHFAGGNALQAGWPCGSRVLGRVGARSLANGTSTPIQGQIVFQEDLARRTVGAEQR